MKPAFRLTVLLSVLIHVLVFTPWLLSPSKPVSPPPQAKTLTFDLQPAYAPQVELPPAPEHMEDDITKANRSDGRANEKPSSSEPQQASQALVDNKVQETPAETQETKLPDVIQSHSNGLMLSEFLKAQAAAKEKFTAKGMTMNELDESALADSHIPSPLDQDEEEKARWFNAVLKRITEQVNYVWVKPKGLSSNTWGVIRLDIDPNGYLMDAWVHLPSGNAQLDRSAMRAVKQVLRYDIPHSEKLARYYQHLEFRYRGDEQEG